MEKETIYDVDFFIKKFESISNEEWGDTCLSNHCVLWHCGVRETASMDFGGYTRTKESIALAEILCPSDWEVTNGYKESYLYALNDGFQRLKCDRQLSPKQRVLNALYEIKESKVQQTVTPTYINIQKELAVLPQEETSDTIHTSVLKN